MSMHLSTKLNGSAKAKIAASLWTILVIVASSVPGSNTPRVSILGLEHLDKVVHWIMYGGVVLLWSIALSKAKAREIAFVFVASICLGVSMEILQNNVFVERSFEILDIIANIMGSISGLVLYYKIFKKPKIC